MSNSRQDWGPGDVPGFKLKGLLTLPLPRSTLGGKGRQAQPLSGSRAPGKPPAPPHHRPPWVRNGRQEGAEGEEAETGRGWCGSRALVGRPGQRRRTGHGGEGGGMDFKHLSLEIRSHAVFLVESFPLNN